MNTQAYKNYDDINIFKRAWQLEAQEVQKQLAKMDLLASHDSHHLKNLSTKEKRKRLIQSLLKIEKECAKMTPAEISKIIGFHEVTVRRLLREMNIKYRKKYN